MVTQVLTSVMEDIGLAFRLLGTILLTIVTYFYWQHVKRKSKGHNLVGAWVFYSLFLFLIFAISVRPYVAYFLGGFTAYIMAGIFLYLIWYDRAKAGKYWFSSDRLRIVCWPLFPFSELFPCRWKERCLTINFGFLLRFKRWLITPNTLPTPFLSPPVGKMLLFLLIIVFVLFWGIKRGTERAIQVDRHIEKTDQKIELKADSLGREIKETRLTVDSAKVRADSAAARADTAKMQADSLKRQIKALQSTQNREETSIERRLRETQIETLKSRVRQLERRQSTSLLDYEQIKPYLQNLFTKEQTDSLRRYHEENVYGRIRQQTQQSENEEYDYNYDDRN